MDNYSKRAYHIFQYCSLFIIIIGLVMFFFNARVTGKAGREKGSRQLNVSYSGWQIASLGAILYIANYFQAHRKNKNNY
jgi:hypothetical protein